MDKRLNMQVLKALNLAILATVLQACAEHQVLTQPQNIVPEQVAPQAGPEPKAAKELLLRMAHYLAKLPKFTVNLQENYDVVQASGQKIEFSETRKIIVDRPNGLRVELEQSSGEKHTVLYDGKDITVVSPSQNVYAQTNKPGGIDDAVMYFLKDLHMRLPLALMLTSRLADDLEKRTQAFDYVEKTAIYGKASHHLAGQTETVDYQVWIADGPQPLPLRVVLTYKNSDGEPQFHAQFSDWNLTPQISATQFTFTPTNGARKIAFAAQLPSIVPVASESHNPPGEKP